MKKLVLITAMAMLCSAAIAQTKIGSACTMPGQFLHVGDDVFLCGAEGWGKFSTVGNKFFRVTYSISENGKVVWSGFMSMRDGKPATQQEYSKTTYVAEVKKDDSGKILMTQADVLTGRFLTLAPAVMANSKIKMYVAVEDSVLKSLETVAADDLTIQKPVVTRFNATQTLEMDQDKEMAISIPSGANDGIARYTLKLVATAI